MHGSRDGVQTRSPESSTSRDIFPEPAQTGADLEIRHRRHRKPGIYRELMRINADQSDIEQKLPESEGKPYR
jgi:hypothetical protein